MSFMHYCKYIVCKKGQRNQKTACDHKTQAEVMKEKYLRSKNQHCVRFSDEIYFRYSPKDKLCIIYKLGEQYCFDCIQEDKKPNRKDKNRYYCWITVGYNFKLDINFYKMLENTNKKISQKVYINQIFQPIMKP